MKRYWWLFLLLIAVAVKQVIWMVIVPIWHTPDEQAHFAQLQWYAEKNNTDVDSGKNLSREVALSEELLGTRRDDRGNNLFTYHPGYRIGYSQSSKGIYEDQINSLNLDSRVNYVDREAAMYPPFFYQLSVSFYNGVYKNGLIDRIFAARLFSVICQILLVVCAYFTGKIIWGDKLRSLTLAIIVGFHPMVSFVASGIHPDNLLNLIYSAGILVSLLILKNGVRFSYLGVLGILVVLGIETKQLMFFFIPLAGAVVVYKFLVDRKYGKLGVLGGSGALIFPVLAFIFQIPIPYMTAVSVNSPLWSMNFFEYLKFRIPRLMFEMWPWFWGVFKWLGITLNPIVMKIITRAAIISGVGVVVRVVREVREVRLSKENNFEFTALIFSVVSIFSYILYLIFWDWRLMQAMGFSQGLQGRYLFPNIVPIMLIILIGIKELGRLFKAEKAAVILLGVSVVILNIISLHTVTDSYYDLSSWKVFVTQFSQYKPEIVKSLAIF